jgi:polysaccharide export outer membrane protein
MFKTPTDYVVSNDSLLFSSPKEYIIAVDDRLNFNLATNQGEMIIQGNLGGVQGGSIDYIVRPGGNVELPILGVVHVEGLSIKQCEDTLEKLYSTKYQQPFVQLKITSQRVIVFPGNGNDARVVFLNNPRTTLMEVIAQSGGIPERGKANTVKIIRKYGEERKMFVVDLSDIDGLKYADLLVQANDYIYIEPRPYLIREMLQEAGPVMSLITSSLAFFAIIRGFN